MGERAAAAVAWYFADVGATGALSTPLGSPRRIAPADAAVLHKQAWFEFNTLTWWQEFFKWEGRPDVGLSIIACLRIARRGFSEPHQVPEKGAGAVAAAACKFAGMGATGALSTPCASLSKVTAPADATLLIQAMRQS